MYHLYSKFAMVYFSGIDSPIVNTQNGTFKIVFFWDTYVRTERFITYGKGSKAQPVKLIYTLRHTLFNI